jgi:hypothetical protein
MGDPATIDRIRTVYESVAPLMGEMTRRRWAAAEARAYGWGGIQAVSVATGLSANTIRKGLAELGEAPASGPRVRRHGGGRKRLSAEDPGLRPTLERLLTGEGAGRSPHFRWCCESTAWLAGELRRRGHAVSPRTVGRMLRDAGYRLEGNRPSSPRTNDGRRFQFEYIAQMIDRFDERKGPVVAVSFRDHATFAGGEDPREPSPGDAYRRDKLAARYAARAIGAWWQDVDLRDRTSAEEMLLVVDGCGSDTGRRRASKAAFSALPARLGFPIQVCHLPPGIIRWADVERWSYSKASRARRGHAAVRHEVVIQLLVAGRPVISAGGVAPCQTPDGAREDRGTTTEHSTRPGLADDWNYRLVPSRTRNRSI